MSANNASDVPPYYDYQFTPHPSVGLTVDTNYKLPNPYMQYDQSPATAYSPYMQSPTSTSAYGPYYNAVKAKRESIKKNSRIVEDEYGPGEWLCVDCGVNEYQTPLKRKNVDGKRTLCNTCYVKLRVRTEKAERGRSRPIITGLVTPLRPGMISTSLGAAGIASMSKRSPTSASQHSTTPINSGFPPLSGFNDYQYPIYDNQLAQNQMYYSVPQQMQWNFPLMTPHYGYSEGGLASDAVNTDGTSSYFRCEGYNDSVLYPGARPEELPFSDIDTTQY